MWILKSCGEHMFYLLPGKEYVVGKRKDCEILIENDNSISRKHAIIRVGKTVHQAVSISLEDCSKYGTNVNNSRISTQTLLSDGDQILFGILGSKYRIQSFPVIVTSSSVTNSAEKKSIQDAVAALGGYCVPEWRESCTHLVMDKFLMTLKAVCALASSKPIVKPNYLWSWWKSLEQGNSPPDIKSYLPPLAEDCLKNKSIDLSVCEERKTLFQKKKFLFISAKQFSSMGMPILLAGGEPELVLKVNEKQLLSPDTLVVMYPQTTTQSKESDLANKLAQILKRHSKRMINESEIGFSIVFNSIAKYCNPSFQYDLAVDNSMMETETQPDFTSFRITVSETQNTSIPDTFDCQANVSFELFGSKASATPLKIVSEMQPLEIVPETQPLDMVPETQTFKEEAETQVMEVTDSRSSSRKRLPAHDSPVQRKLPRLQADVEVVLSDSETSVKDLFEKSATSPPTSANTSVLKRATEQRCSKPETNNGWLTTKTDENCSDLETEQQQFVIEFKSLLRMDVPKRVAVTVEGVNFKKFRKHHTIGPERQNITFFEHVEEIPFVRNACADEVWARAEARLHEESDEENPFKDL